jgi:hypothetical protein
LKKLGENECFNDLPRSPNSFAIEAKINKKSRVRNFALAQLFDLTQEDYMGKKENECEEKKQRS